MKTCDPENTLYYSYVAFVTKIKFHFTPMMISSP